MTPDKSKQDDNSEIYPCADCGKLISKNQGGTVFTVCEECWDKKYGKSKQGIEEILNEYRVTTELNKEIGLFKATLAIKEYYLGLLPKEKDNWSGIPMTKMFEETNDVLLKPGLLHDEQIVGYNTAIQEMRDKLTKEEV